MTGYLDSKNFPCDSVQSRRELDGRLAALMQRDFHGDFFELMAGYQRTLADNARHLEWPEIHDKLRTLFMCGRAIPLDGPMIGIPVCIRDSDFLRRIANDFGHDRSAAAKLEVLANAWNATFADTGLWMGKTFEPVTREVASRKCDRDAGAMAAYDDKVTRIGRNFFRAAANPNAFQALGLPAISLAWHLKDRPTSVDAAGFDGSLLQRNLNREQYIPYSKTGGSYLANMGESVLAEMRGKQVYSLNYRWKNLKPVFPMSCLVDEIVQIADGLYLGQLIYATRHFSLGTLPLIPIEPGEPYAPRGEHPDYGYQNNGYFLMMDPDYASRVYAAFPQLRPRAGEIGYLKPSDERQQRASVHGADWRTDPALRQKFTTLIASDEGSDVQPDENESVLQMLQRISACISAQTNPADNLTAFEPLHRLFRSGVAPEISHGLFQGAGAKGYNVRIDSGERHGWYGETEVTHGFDYYHGATLNLHCGFAGHFQASAPEILSRHLSGIATPNILNMVWHNIGKYIFPWAGKSFETISPRKLSMLLDESADLASRYPGRVSELKSHPASAPHYQAVKADASNPRNGRYATHLSRSWDQGMSDADKAFWQRQADQVYVMGYNLQDKRILSADALMRLNDMNYRIPDSALQQASIASGSPFARQGYAFLGVADQDSILPLNKGRKVFQFHYRYPMTGGPAPIGFCLDELVEIADGLFLGQLIYSTALHLPFHSATDPADYDYQLFGYFLLLDDDWERHRQAIGLDTVNQQ